MRRDPVRPPPEPARWDCRQSAGARPERPGPPPSVVREPPLVIIGRLVSFPGLRLHAQARAGWAAPQFAATLIALWLVTFAAIGVSAPAPAPPNWRALSPS